MRNLQEALKETVLNTITAFNPPELLKVYECPKCGSPVRVMRAVIKGQERIIDRCLECENRQMAREAEQNRDRALAKKMQEIFNEESLINENLKNATFDSYRPANESQEKAKKVVQRFAERFTPDNPCNLMLAGPYGVGKSHLAKAATDQIMDKGYSCIFISVPRLFTKIKSTFGKKEGITEDQIMQTLAKVDCLVLDDIGAEHIEIDRNGEGKGWGVAKIFEIVDSRAGKHTIYTTNLSGEQMEKRFGERNMSRLMYRTVPLRIEGQDYRRKTFEGV